MVGVPSELLHVYNVYYYMVFWILNGFLQSSGWPAMIAIMANWFGKSKLVGISEILLHTGETIKRLKLMLQSTIDENIGVIVT